VCGARAPWRVASVRARIAYLLLSIFAGTIVLTFLAGGRLARGSA